VDAYVVPIGDEARRRAVSLVTGLRRAGVRVDMAYGGRGLKGAMKGADRSGARLTVVLGERDIEAGEAQVKDMSTGDQVACPLDQLEQRIKEQLS
jgi:histidyl-tRNA synthetase